MFLRGFVMLPCCNCPKREQKESELPNSEGSESASYKFVQSGGLHLRMVYIVLLFTCIVCSPFLPYGDCLRRMCVVSGCGWRVSRLASRPKALRWLAGAPLNWERLETASLYFTQTGSPLEM